MYNNTVQTFSGSKTSRGKYWATPSHVTFSNEVRKCMAEVEALQSVVGLTLHILLNCFGFFPIFAV